MSTLQEIEDAIRALPPEDRERLADNLPNILPELNGDSEWRRIINDPRPSQALSALADEIDAKMAVDPELFPIISDKDFESRS
jgi:hypothetical protein